MITQTDQDNLVKEIIIEIMKKHGKIEKDKLFEELNDELVRRDISSHLKILVDNGIVKEEFDENKKENVYSPTKDGEKKIEQLMKDKPEIFDCIYCHILKNE